MIPRRVYVSIGMTGISLKQKDCRITKRKTKRKQNQNQIQNQKPKIKTETEKRFAGKDVNIISNSRFI